MTEKRLAFVEANHPTLGWGYEVYNQKSENICAIRKVRTGQWMHWCMVFEFYHLKDELNLITISPGCQDEIREFCKKHNAKKNETNKKEVKREKREKT